jgi:hypothetical protein
VNQELVQRFCKSSAIADRNGPDRGGLWDELESWTAVYDLRASLCNFGLKVGMIGTVKFEARIKELVENFPDLPCWWNRCSLSGGLFASRHPASPLTGHRPGR